MSRITNNLLAVSLCAALIPLTAGNAIAYEKGDLIWRAGLAKVSPVDDSDAIDVAGLETLDGAGVDGNTQIGLTLSYMATPKIAFELLLATPFTHDINVKGTNLSAGEVTQLPPTISLSYYFAGPSSKFQPYVGAGINYTIFFEEDVDTDLNRALDDITGELPGTTDAKLELSNSVGVAIQAGFDFQVSENWMVNAGFWMIDINTKATIKAGDAEVSFDVEIDPFVYMLGVAHKF
ncbi:MAG: outer membrane protein OmpW [Moraxellaceae bacterium]|nr:MAG: outer membrane protein OmpW [Moraxellaceae bacterium]